MQLTVTSAATWRNAPGPERQGETKRSATGYAVVKANAGAAFIAVETARNAATGATVYRSRLFAADPHCAFRNNIGCLRARGGARWCLETTSRRRSERPPPRCASFPTFEKTRFGSNTWRCGREFRSCLALYSTARVDKNLGPRRLEIVLLNINTHS